MRSSKSVVFVLLYAAACLLAYSPPVHGLSGYEALEVCSQAGSFHLDLSHPTLNVGVKYGDPTFGRILITPGTSPTGEFSIEYPIDTPCQGTYLLDLKLAAQESRPLRISLNGIQLPGQVAAGVTGGWYQEQQQWFAEPVLLRLYKGHNTLRLATSGFFPHVSEIQLRQSSERDDITGVWRSPADGGDLYQFYQDKGQVVGIYVNRNFAHLLRGSYTTSSEIQGTFDDRKDRRNGCTTRMLFVIRMTGHDTFQLKWLARDSNCDLQDGQTSPWLNFERVL